MIDNFADEIFNDPFFRQENEFTLFTETINEHGEPVKSEVKEVLVSIVQPAGSDDLAILPEGSRFNPTVRVMTQQAVCAGDLVSWHGHQWRIVNDAIWSDYGFYDTLAVRYEGSQTNDSGGFIVT